MTSTRHEQEERRCTERVTLRCTLYVFTEGAPGVLQASSTNVSSRGLYCRSAIAIPAGQRLRCLIELTPDGFRSNTGSLCLECFLEVVRIERVGAEYGLGCRIHKYRLMRPALSQLPGVETTCELLEHHRV